MFLHFLYFPTRSVILTLSPKRAKFIWHKARCLVDIFHHIRQVAARNAKLVLGCSWDIHFGKREVVWSHRWYQSKEMVVSYRLSIVTVALYLTLRSQFAIECLRRSNQQGNHFGAKFGEEGVDRVSQISARDTALLYAEEIVSISSAVWAQCTNVTDRQTNRQTDHKTLA